MTRLMKPAGSAHIERLMPIGAEILAGVGVSFRVWAPGRTTVDVHIGAGVATPLVSEGNGYFSALVPNVNVGARYRFSLDGGPPLPDPASRYQPDGPHGQSVVVDPSAFVWSDDGWPGVDRSGLVVYEMHVGTFTRGGTWRSAVERLDDLAELGISCLEVMPVAEFPGAFGWGYDGVDWFAPSHLYGTPDDFRFFVNAAHAVGLAVVLDVVYNHLGPDGCYLAQYSPSYFHSRATEWGQAINFDGTDAAPVREFVLANASYWMREFHLDGLRIDAAQSIHDTSTPHILTEIASTVRQAAGVRPSWIVAEHEPQHAHLVASPDQHGFGLDALWNDDFHHAAMVAATGRREAYYSDYAGSPQEFVSAAKYGFLYQGQWYSWQDRPRGTPTIGTSPDAFVCFLQNHDQVANWARGQRLHEVTSPAKLRTLTALLLLGPWIPMLFQGQEHGARSPFYYFADHAEPLASAVRDGRRDFLAQFHSANDLNVSGGLVDPSAHETFTRSIVADPDPLTGAATRALHASLLQLRESDVAFRAQHRRGLDGAVLLPHAFVLRFFAQAADLTSEDRLLLINLGPQVDLAILPEPLLAPPLDCQWSAVWSSDEPLYGGPGIMPVQRHHCWCLPAESATVFAPRRHRGPST